MSTASALRRFGSATHSRATNRRTAAFAALFLFAALPAAGRAEDRYGYYRVVEGAATVVQNGESQAAQENQPLLTGDRLATSRSARVEVEMADGTVVRVAGDSDLEFAELAASDDGNGRNNFVSVHRGEAQLVTAGGAESRVDTDNASMYLQDAGTYRVESRDGTTLLLVRSGRAEVRTRSGAVTVDANEEAWVEGDRAPEVGAAGTTDSLERWASTLDEQYHNASWDDDYVDSSLGYSASRMASYGSWVTLDNRRAWRPRVGADWSPYRDGRWASTPSGLTWVSYEPWGWVPYHYGTWDYAPGWGWAWYPGYTYAPAWVYWYWGPSYVGWCPVGYYSNYYGPRFHAGYDYGWGFGRRVHGWGGGSHRHFDRWNFVDSHSLYDRRLANHTRSSGQIGTELPRGIISTDTRGLSPGEATRPSGGMRLLANGAGHEKPILQDVSRFVARDPNVGADVARVALPVDRDGGAGGRGTAGGGWQAEKPAAVGGGGRGDNGRWAQPGEKPATATGNRGNGDSGRQAQSGDKPAATGGQGDWRGAGGRPPAAASGGSSAGNDVTRRASPRGTSDEGRRNSGGGKPAVESRADSSTRPATRQQPESASDSSWRSGNAGGGKPGSARPAAAKPSEGAARRVPERSSSDEGWRSGGNGGGGSEGRQQAPRTSVRSVRPSPSGGNDAPSADESWRGAGRESNAGGRSPVRRIVEGVRSNRQEPAPPADKPSTSRDTRRPSPPPVRHESPPARQRAPETSSRPAPEPSRESARPREADKPQEPQRRESAREHRDDGGQSRDAAQHNDRGSRGDHSGGQTRSRHGNNDNGPNR